MGPVLLAMQGSSTELRYQNARDRTVEDVRTRVCTGRWPDRAEDHQEGTPAKREAAAAPLLATTYSYAKASLSWAGPAPSLLLYLHTSAFSSVLPLLGSRSSPRCAHHVWCDEFEGGGTRSKVYVRAGIWGRTSQEPHTTRRGQRVRLNANAMRAST